MIPILARILIRQARKHNPAAPEEWLDSLLTTKWEAASQANGQITGTNVNGKAVYVQAVPGCSIADILTAAELALSALERGLSAPPTVTQAILN